MTCKTPPKGSNYCCHHGKACDAKPSVTDPRFIYAGAEISHYFFDTRTSKTLVSTKHNEAIYRVCLSRGVVARRESEHDRRV